MDTNVLTLVTSCDVIVLVELYCNLLFVIYKYSYLEESCL